MRWLFRSRTARHAVAGLVMAALLIALAGSLALAQNTNRKLKVGDTVSGTLDAKTFAQVYTFDAAKTDTITITATSKTKGLLLALLLNNAAGQTLTQTAELTKPEVAIRDFKPSEDGTYYITVLRATGVQGNTTGTFTLSLSGTAAAPAVATVTLTDQLSVALTWASTDDMNLEVRDPIGGSVNFNNPGVASGGQLSGNVNADCSNTTADNPTETATWGKGNVPAGSYEIIVYFAKACPQGTTPLPFTVTVTVDGKAQDPIRGSLDNAGGVYVASFVLSSPDQVEVQQGGPNLGADLTPFSAKISSPGTLNNRNQASGTINRANPADAYSFQGRQGETVSIAMNAINGGSLDPLTLLLDSNGGVLTSNDDAGPDTRNSLIRDFVLPADGKYTIIATRFALALGGTEGNYALTLTRGRTVVGPTKIPTGANGTTTAPATPVATASLGSGLPPGSIEALLSWDTRADLRLLIRDPKGRSVYTDTPKIDSGGVLDRSTNLNCKNTTGIIPQDYIYWTTPQPPQGTYEVKVWENSNCNDTANATFSLNVSVQGKDIINLTNSPRANKQVFLITFTIDANGNATAGRGDFVTNEFSADLTSAIQSAPTITYNQTVNGQITGDTKYVVYTFNAKAGEKVKISMVRNTDGSGGNLDPELFLIGADGHTQLAFNDDHTDQDLALAASDSRINYTITADGTYTIVATHYGVELGGTTGSYKLTLAGAGR